MADLEIKNVGKPDEIRPFTGRGQAAVVNVLEHPVLFGTFESGWRWSEHLKPIAGTDSCQATHLLYCLSGRMRIKTNNGEQGEIDPGDVAAISPGHDAWVVGDEPCVAVDFGGYAQYAKRWRRILGPPVNQGVPCVPCRPAISGVQRSPVLSSRAAHVVWAL